MAAALIAGILVATGVVGGKKKTGDPQTVTIDLTSAGDPGTDPFTASVTVTDTSASTPVSPVNPSASATTAPATTAAKASGKPISSKKVYTFPKVPSTTGDSPGLYGGTLNTRTCNKKQLISFLKSNPAKARAWIAAQNADPSLRWSGGTLTMNNVEAYIGTLTPLVLRFNTYLVNHGYNNGRANPIPEMLQAGNAVLVDQYGVPRARCSCGNPLTKAKGNPQQVRYRGVPGNAFDPVKPAVVVPVAAKKPVKEFVLVDSKTGKTFTRAPGTDGTKDKQTNQPAPTPTALPTTPAPTSTPTPTPTGPTAQPGTAFNGGFGIVPTPNYDWRANAYFAPYQDVPTIEVAQTSVDDWRVPGDDSQSGYSVSDLTKATSVTPDAFFDDTWKSLKASRQVLSTETDDRFTVGRWTGKEYKITCSDTASGKSQMTALLLLKRADGATVALLVRGPTATFDDIRAKALAALDTYQRQ